MFRKELPGGIFTEAIAHGAEVPSFYNPIELEKVRNSSPKYDWKISKVKRITPLTKTPAGESETSPHSYNIDSSKNRTQKSSPRYSYGKEKGKSFINNYSKQHAWVPGPAAYKLDSAYNKITIGARRGYK